VNDPRHKVKPLNAPGSPWKKISVGVAEKINLDETRSCGSPRLIPELVSITTVAMAILPGYFPRDS
jgi:hypothetical protein